MRGISPQTPTRWAPCRSLPVVMGRVNDLVVSCSSSEVEERGSVVVQDLDDDVVSETLKGLGRILARRHSDAGRSGMLARRVREVGLEEHVVWETLDGETRRGVLEPEAPVDLTAEVLRRQ